MALTRVSTLIPSTLQTFWMAYRTRRAYAFYSSIITRIWVTWIRDDRWEQVFAGGGRCLHRSVSDSWRSSIWQPARSSPSRVHPFVRSSPARPACDRCSERRTQYFSFEPWSSPCTVSDIIKPLDQVQSRWRNSNVKVGTMSSSSISCDRRSFSSVSCASVSWCWSM